jgi:glycosyltransferase involved in cell wall biosynthesis
VVVPTLGRARSVERLLSSLGRQVDPPPFEVVVSVDGPGDDTPLAVARFSNRLPVRAVTREHGGRGAACNSGVRHSRGRVLVLLDDDMEADSGCLRAHANAHQGGAPRALVGPIPIVADAATPPIVRYRARGVGLKLERLSRSGTDPAVRDMYTSNFSLPRALFLEMGGFDESFVRYGNEDHELLLRLRQAGVRLGWAPEAVARQHYEKTFSDLARDTAGEGYNAVMLAERHPEVLDELYVMDLSRASALRRLSLTVGAGLARVWPGLLALGAAVIQRAGRRNAERLFRYYDIAFDMHYWLGVQRALRGDPGREPQSWPEWVRARRRAANPGPRR